ncbi:zinc-binding dehydrogenase [Streptomyces eurythermus]|uniref:zinc-binding dehydrogenase n=1 Tax=Streptomyces eurythermus TaxID=42237 RepID=UPI0036D220AF
MGPARRTGRPGGWGGAPNRTIPSAGCSHAGAAPEPPGGLRQGVIPGPCAPFAGRRPRRRPWIERRVDRANLERAARLALDGVLAPVITAVHPLSDAPAALAAVENGHASGKIVIKVA